MKTLACWAIAVNLLLTSWQISAMTCGDLFSGVQSQVLIHSRVTKNKPRSLMFVKDIPILGYRITSERAEDLPLVIRRFLGETDGTSYSPEYLRKSFGSVIALQMNGDKPDFYIIGKDTYDAEYQTVSLLEVGAKNSKLLDKLMRIEDLAKLMRANDANLVGALKIVPVEMIRMSDIGYKVAARVTIQSPWGEQSKPSGQDAYLVFDASKDMFYLVNSDPNGLPISYVPAK